VLRNVVDKVVPSRLLTHLLDDVGSCQSKFFFRYIPIPNSYFLLPTSYFLLPTSRNTLMALRQARVIFYLRGFP
jgi:hypothetical protein